MRGVENTYKEGDCNLSDSVNTRGCEADKWQMYLWVKGNATECSSWRQKHRQDKQNNNRGGRSKTVRPTKNV